MSLHAWCDHNAYVSKPGPFDPPPRIEGDRVDPDVTLMPDDGLMVMEGKDAEDSIRHYLTPEQRERFGVLLP